MATWSRRDVIKGLACGAAAGTVGGSCAPVVCGATGAQGAEAWPAVDVLVCGGGPAGVAAAMMAASQGRKTLLVERYGRLGGMAVQAMVGPLMGSVQSERVDAILERLGGRRVNYEFIDL